MARPRSRNEYTIEGDTALLRVKRPKGHEGPELRVAIDLADLDRVLAIGTWIAQWSEGMQGFYIRCHSSDGGMLHHIILGVGKGQWVDHVNGDILDNHRANLRPSSPALNNQNRRGAQKNSKSGHRNVHKVGERWRVSLDLDGKGHHFGYFPTLDQAVEAAKAARAKMFPHSTR